MGRVKELYRQLVERENGHSSNVDQSEFELSILSMEHNRRPLTTKQINELAETAAKMDRSNRKSS
jgi:hypothetical protein